MTTPISAVRERWEKYVLGTLPEPLEDGEKLLTMSVDYNDAADFFLAEYATLLESCLPEEKESYREELSGDTMYREGFNSCLQIIRSRIGETREMNQEYGDR